LLFISFWSNKFLAETSISGEYRFRLLLWSAKDVLSLGC
jgi:hypothetical protein